jgi:hypothetical protein
MLPPRSVLLAFGACLACSASALAAAVDLSTFADRIDAIGCARAAEEAGDAVLLSKLGASGSREVTLVAVRAAPYAHAPEDLVAGLVELACGRDPNLAPEAAASLYAIGQDLTQRELAEREVLLADLEKAEQRLAKGCEHDPETDVAFALDVTKQRLQVLRETPF